MVICEAHGLGAVALIPLTPEPEACEGPKLETESVHAGSLPTANREPPLESPSVRASKTWTPRPAGLICYL